MNMNNQRKKNFKEYQEKRGVKIIVKNIKELKGSVPLAKYLKAIKEASEEVG